MIRRASEVVGRGVLSLTFSYLASRLQVVGERERALDLTIHEAQRQINLQYSSSDSRDLKTLGWVATGIGTSAVLAALQKSWDPWWLVPTTLVVAAVASYGWSIWLQQLERGPKLQDWYETFSGTLTEAKTDLLAHLFRALEHNDNLLSRKRQRYAIRTRLLITSAVVVVPVWLHQVVR